MGRSYLFFCIILLISCDNNKQQPRKYKLAKNPNPINIEPCKPNVGFTWDAPENWECIEKHNFSVADYQIPYNEELIDLSITKFPGDAGGIIANVNRWRKQLGLEPHNLQQINKNSIIGSSMIGSFSAYKLVNNNSDDAFLCAILSYGNSTIFVKLQSSIMIANSLEKKFLDFCSSFKPLD